MSFEDRVVLITGAGSGIPPEELEQQAKSVPFLRFAQPEEMAYTIAFLCSPQAEFITGQVVSPNGGYMN